PGLELRRDASVRERAPTRAHGTTARRSASPLSDPAGPAGETANAARLEGDPDQLHLILIGVVVIGVDPFVRAPRSQHLDRNTAPVIADKRKCRSAGSGPGRPPARRTHQYVA